MTQKKFVDDPSSWVPMQDQIDLMVAGKFTEELGECAAAMSRCIIQGIDGKEPSTGEVNRRWLEKEIADVLANIDLVAERFGLDTAFMADRVRFKTTYLRRWHSMDKKEKGD